MDDSTQETPAPADQASNSDSASKPEPATKQADPGLNLVGVQFRAAGKIFAYNATNLVLKPGDDVVVEIDRGVAAARITLASDGKSELMDPKTRTLKILRKLNDDDRNQIERNHSRGLRAMNAAKERAAYHHLDMKFVQVEYLLDGSKAIFYYTAEERVDFRELVKDLAREFRTRIEMRQIGVRDAAKLLGGTGICGRELCCSYFLREFAPVSIKMAKDQNLELNPGKRAGCCGRLRCCLKYEHPVYVEMIRELPRLGNRVMTTKGPGTVSDFSVLNQTIVVVLDDESEVELKPEDILKDPAPPRSRPKSENEAIEKDEATSTFFKNREGPRRRRPDDSIDEKTLLSLEDNEDSSPEHE